MNPLLINTNSKSRLVLRKETYGGLIFNPDDGTHLELDLEAFDFCLSYLRGTSKLSFLLNKEKKNFLKEISHLLGSLKNRPFRFIENANAPTLIDFQITHKCFMACPHCYASSNKEGQHANFSDIKRIIEELSSLGVCQLSLGGGEPLLHPEIIEILNYARAQGIVPNLTTSGINLSKPILSALKETCGAVALSLEGIGLAFNERRSYGWEFFLQAVNKIKEEKIPLVFQITLSKETFKNIFDIVDYVLSEAPSLYGVIFLAFKPAGRGLSFDSPLSALSWSEIYPELKTAFLKISALTRVGYDCCLSPSIIGLDKDLSFSELNLIEGCSATRGSLGISPELEVLPCTFLENQSLGNLKNQSFEEIWNSSKTKQFRKTLLSQVSNNETCESCSEKTSCLGGCPAWNLTPCYKKSIPYSHSP